MKNSKLFTPMLAALTLAAGLISCNDDEPTADTGTTDGRTPITLISSVSTSGTGAAAATTVSTRSVSQSLQEEQLAEGVMVGVFAQSNSEYIENGDNCWLTADGNGSFTGTQMYFPEDGGQVSLYAYAPYSSSWASQLWSYNDFSVATDQSTDEGYLNSDLLLGYPSSGNPVSSTSSAITLSFSHKLSKLNLNFSGYTAAGVNLAGATVTVMNVLKTVSVNVAEGTIGNASGAEGEITAAKFESNATTFTASAIFVPQTVQGTTNFVMVTTEGGVQYMATLNQDVTFQSGKRYTYTLQFSGGGSTGEPVSVSLVLGSVVDAWEDGNEDLGGGASATTAYGIGDYLMSDGSFVKNADLTTDDYNNVVAVVFSKEVSQADSDAGYNAYAMGLHRFGNKAWPASNVVFTSTYSSYTDAIADLDGLTKTRTILASDEYTNLEEDDKSNSLVNYANYTSLYPLPSGTSEWFTPSFGQMIQILNNLGGGTFTANTSLTGPSNVGSPMYYVTNTDVLDAVNAYVMPITNEEMFLTDQNESSLVYTSVTEYSESQFWAVTTRRTTVNEDETVYNWGFGRNGYKSSGGRSVAPCVAITIPDPE